MQGNRGGRGGIKEHRPDSSAGLAERHSAKEAEIGAGEPAPESSVRNHQQVVMKHVLDHELRMDLAGALGSCCSAKPYDIWCKL